MYKILLLMGISILGYSCTEVDRNTSTSDSNKEIILEMYDAFNKHDWVKMASFYSDSALFKDPAFGKNSLVQSRAQIVNKYQELEKMFPDVKDSIVNIYSAENNHIVVEFISSGSISENEKWYLPISTIFKIENNLISEDFTYYDNSQE